MVRRVRGDAGGIAALLRTIDANGGALEYDLMCRARATLADIGGRVPWSALRSFVANLGPDSALFLAQNPEDGVFYQPWQAQFVLADVFDALMGWATGWAASNRKKGSPRPKPPKPYPRPGAKETGRGERIGREAIPIKDFDEWWEG